MLGLAWCCSLFVSESRAQLLWLSICESSARWLPCFLIFYRKCDLSNTYEAIDAVLRVLHSWLFLTAMESSSFRTIPATTTSVICSLPFSSAKIQDSKKNFFHLFHVLDRGTVAFLISVYHSGHPALPPMHLFLSLLDAVRQSALVGYATDSMYIDDILWRSTRLPVSQSSHTRRVASRRPKNRGARKRLPTIVLAGPAGIYKLSSYSPGC